MDLNDLRAELDAYANDPRLTVPDNLYARAEALDFLHFVREMARIEQDKTPEGAQLQQDAQRLAKKLTALNNQLFQAARTAIRQGTLTGIALRHYCDRFTAYRPGLGDWVYTSYDGLDVLFDGIFQLKQAPTPTLLPTAEMVRCEETPARVLLAMVDQVALGADDLFYDLGSGLGQVVMAVHLLTGVAAKGVEIEPAFCTFAQRQAQALGLTGVTFLNQDARQVDYQDGTVFFLFTPFRGQLLQTVLARLQKVAQQHVIRLCTFGPCTPHVAAQPWLHPITPAARHEYKLVIFESHVGE
ncbi:MAG: hypothetical protein R3C14_14960 [Caldilineaceae bacterium]